MITEGSLKRRRLLAALILTVVVLGAVVLGFPFCGHYRWDVKTASDPDARLLVGLRAVPRSTRSLSLISSPRNNLPPGHRFTAIERTLWRFDARIDSFQLGPDGDIHLSVNGVDGAHLTVEIPCDECVSASSPFRETIAATRQKVVARLGRAWPIPRHTDVWARFTGPGFFDRPGGSWHTMEIHPLLEIEFLPGPPAQSARPSKSSSFSR